MPPWTPTKPFPPAGASVNALAVFTQRSRVVWGFGAFLPQTGSEGVKTLIFALGLGGPPEWLELDWEAPEGCPDRAAMLDLAAGYLDPDHLDPDLGTHPSGTVAVRGQVSAVDHKRWSLQLSLVTRSGESTSEIDGESCGAVARAAAFKIAVAAELEAALERDEQPQVPGAPVVAEEPDPEPAIRTEVEAQPEPPKRGLDGALRLEGGVSSGALPSVGAGFALHGAFLFQRWRLEIGASAWPVRAVRLDDPEGVGGDLTLVAADLRACPRLEFGVVELPACVGVEGGVVHGKGVGISEPAAAVQPWFAASLGAGLRFRVHERVRLGLEAQVPVAIVRPAFHLEDIGRIHQAGVADLRGLAGIEVRL